MSDLNWIWLLQGLVFVLIFAEIFIPSGGIISVFAAITLIGSWIFLVREGNPLLITLMLIFDMSAIPILVIWGLKALQKSSLTNTIELGSAAGYQVDLKLSSNLIGKVATAITPLRPSGQIRVGEEIMEALSSGEMIDPGASVKIISVSENKIFVDLN
jgi:membrane-bound serine protease (ClpP class)